MSYRIMRLALLARFPRTMKRRPEAKAVLVALAYYAHDEVSAKPSIETIGACAEISENIVRSCLQALCRVGIISQHAPPGQHRARTWRIHLDVLERLADDPAPHHVEALKSPDLQHAEDLSQSAPQHPADLTEKNSSAPQIQTSAPQIVSPGPHFSSPAPQHVEPDQYLICSSDRLTDRGRREDAPPAPVSPDKREAIVNRIVSEHPYADDVAVIAILRERYPVIKFPKAMVQAAIEMRDHNRRATA